MYVLTYLANKNGSDSDSELGHMHRCTILFFNLLTAADLVSCDLTCLVLAPRSVIVPLNGPESGQNLLL